MSSILKNNLSNLWSCINHSSPERSNNFVSRCSELCHVLTVLMLAWVHTSPQLSWITRSSLVVWLAYKHSLTLSKATLLSFCQCRQFARVILVILVLTCFCQLCAFYCSGSKLVFFCFHLLQRHYYAASTTSSTLLPLPSLIQLHSTMEKCVLTPSRQNKRTPGRLYVLIMSRMHFRVNPHSIFA